MTQIRRPFTLVVLTVRNSSQRLPGKALVSYQGYPNLQWIYWRYQSSQLVNKIIVATSTDPSDNSIVDFCQKNGIDVFRGSLGDVTDRIYQAAKPYKPDLVVRGMGDMPFMEPRMLDLGIQAVWDNKVDHARGHTAVDRVPVYGAGNFPYSWECVERLWEESEGDQREHFGALIDQTRESFGLVYPKPPSAYYRWFYRPYRLELDTVNDLALVKRIYSNFGPRARDVIPLRDVVAYLDSNQDVAMINSHVREVTGPLTTYDVEKRKEWTEDQEKYTIEWLGDWTWLDHREKLVLCNSGRCVLGRSDLHGRLVLTNGQIIIKGFTECSCGAGRRWHQARKK